MHSAPMFVASWTTPWLPAPPPPAWLLPHFHGHVLMAFSILQGEYHASFSKECAEISKPCPQQVDLAELQSDYRTKPFVHIHRTDITCICGPTHSSHTAFLRSLDFAPHASMDTFIRYPRWVQYNLKYNQLADVLTIWTLHWQWASLARQP